MKKIVLILSSFVLILSSNAFPADVLDGFTSYSHLSRTMFGVDTADKSFVSDTTIHDLVRLSVITLGPALRGNKGVFFDTTVYHRDMYGLDSTIWGVSSVQWIHGDTVKTLIRIPQNLFGETYQKFAKAAEGPMERRPYFWDHIDDTLILFPVPIRNADSLRITAWRKVSSISASDNLASIPQKFRAPFVHYAAYLLARAKQHPLVQLYRQDYIDAMSLIMSQEFNIADTAGR